ncbi:MAG TPA: hypothetical protein PKB13_07465 [Clostridia bacterium]|nr:hypothetical protein [Clostridia bacterium]
MEKYSWDFNGEAENWYNETYDTIEECLEDARSVAEDETYGSNEPPEKVYIGENKPFVPRVDAECVLDLLEEQACEFAGEVGYDWDSYDHKKQDELDELSQSLTDVVMAWLKKHGRAPVFYAVEDIKEYPLYPAEPEKGK